MDLFLLRVVLTLAFSQPGTDIATGVVTALNFIGAGNTFAYDSSSKTVDISIAGGGGGGGLGTAIKYSDEATASPFSYIDVYATVSEDLLLDTTKNNRCKYINYCKCHTKH